MRRRRRVNGSSRAAYGSAHFIFSFFKISFMYLAIFFIPPQIPSESIGICWNPGIPAGIDQNSRIPVESSGISWNRLESARI